MPDFDMLLEANKPADLSDQPDPHHRPTTIDYPCDPGTQIMDLISYYALPKDAYMKMRKIPEDVINSMLKHWSGEETVKCHQSQMVDTSKSVRTHCVVEDCEGATRSPTELDANGSPTELDANGSPTELDANGSPTELDANGSPTELDANGSPTELDANGSPTELDANGSPTELDANGSPTELDLPVEVRRNAIDSRKSDVSVVFQDHSIIMLLFLCYVCAYTSPYIMNFGTLLYRMLLMSLCQDSLRTKTWYLGFTSWLVSNGEYECVKATKNYIGVNVVLNVDYIDKKTRLKHDKAWRGCNLNDEWELLLRLLMNHLGNTSTDIFVFPLYNAKGLDSYFERSLYGPRFLESEKMQYEWLRLQSFKNWPKSAQAYPVRLAQAGFYYTGTVDDVACYSCGGHIKNWTYPMVAFDVHKRFFPRCHFITGICTKNVPVSRSQEHLSINVGLAATYGTNQDVSGSSNAVTDTADQAIQDTIKALERTPDISSCVLPSAPPSSALGGTTPAKKDEPPEPNMTPSNSFFKRMEDIDNRKNTYANWPHSEIVSGDDLAVAGLFYQGISDRVQCAWCKGVLHKWKIGDDPMTEHRKFYPHCEFVKTTILSQAASANLDSAQRTSPPTHMGVMSKVPKHPNYATVAAREKSFLGWPSQLEQTPQMLADAGFFYVGFGDCVKCFMCNGGLRNWAASDVPWEEHAQWFQDCEYVLMHGRGISAEATMMGQATGASDLTETKATGTAESDSSLDRKILRSIEEMGYDKSIIDDALTKYRRNNGNYKKLTVQSLIDIILDMDVTHHKEPPETPMPAAAANVVPEPKPPSTAPPKSNKSTKSQKRSRSPVPAESRMEDKETLDPKSLLEENRTLKEKTVCKICMEYPVSIVFLPCGHLVSCAQCAPALKLCPICRAKVKGRVKTFMS